MSSLYLDEKFEIQILRFNVRVLQSFGLLLDNSLTSSRHGRVLRKGILYLIIFIHIQFIFGSVVELFLSNEDSHQFESLGLILSYVKGAMQLYALIFSGQNFLDLIKSAEVNFFMKGRPLGSTEIPIFDGYVQTVNRLARFMWATFVLTLSSVFFELVPTFNISMENYATEFDGHVMGRRKTAYKVWTPFQNMDSPYLKADIVYEMISVTIFFIVFTTINLLTLMLIIFFTGHFNLLAEYMENLTDQTGDATSTGMS
jgi:hypothetical protein